MYVGVVWVWFVCMHVCIVYMHVCVVNEYGVGCQSANFDGSCLFGHLNQSK